jgi:Flp pilus assembly pilin Flp
MKRYRAKVRRVLMRAAASTVTEYAIIISVVSIAAVAVMYSIGQKTNSLLDSMNTNFPQ